MTEIDSVNDSVPTSFVMCINSVTHSVQHQVSSLSADVDHRKLTQNIRKDRKDRMNVLQDIRKRSETAQDFIDNYDLIVPEPSESLLKPVLRDRHVHHRNRSGNGARKTIKNYNQRLLQGGNTLRKNNNIIGETNATQTQEDKNATIANDLNERDRRGVEEVATKSENPVKNNQNVTPVVPFYRRVNYIDDQERNKPQKWVHCLDLVGPRLKGYKDSWPPTEMKSRHTDIRRLAELLNTDVSKYTQEEIVALLSQISQIDLRLFQWDYTAITTIMNVIIPGPLHSFKTLKSGVKYMFERWHLDTSMMKIFLEQTRIFRPPCIDITGSDGYTKKAGGVRLFTKPDKSTKKPRGGGESCQSREITTVKHNNNG